MKLEVISYSSADVLGKGEELFKREKKTTGKVVVLMLLLCLAALIPLFVTKVQTAPPGWYVETIAASGGWTSLALDSYDNPHISYFGGYQSMMYVRFDGHTWLTPELVEGYYLGTMNSLALDSDDSPHISYYDSGNDYLKYAKKIDTNWDPDFVDQSHQMVGWCTSLALDSLDRPHISYFDAYAPYFLDLKHAWWNGTDWRRETVDSAGTVGLDTSIALGKDDSVHISYYDYTNEDLKYAMLTETGWSNEAVDTAEDVGTYTSIALAPIKIDHSVIYLPHISYYNSTGGDLKYARYSLSPFPRWIDETVDSADNVGLWTSLALDSNNYPHISYYDETHHDLMYVRKTATGWSTPLRIDETGDVGQYTSIALDSNDNPHISYYDETSGTLKYATSATRRPVADADGPYTGTEGEPVAFDGSGSYDPDGTIVGYEWDFGDGNTGTGVTPTHTYVQEDVYTVTLTVTDNRGATDTDTTTATIGDAEPIADFSGSPRGGNPPLTVGFTDLSISIDGIISWLWSFGDGETSTLQNPTHTYLNEGLYTVSLTVEEADGDIDTETKEYYVTVHLFFIETVDSAEIVGLYTSIAVDSNDYPHISYQDDDNGDLKYTHWNGSAWDTETVDSDGWVGQYTSLALDSNDYPHISYTNTTGWDLKYAKWNGSEWNIETVDSGGNVGTYTSIALDSFDRPHISYFDDTNDDLKYAKWTGATWVIETVPDPAGSVGWWTSIAFEPPNDYPHISYSDSSNGDLKYARWNGSAWVIETVDSAVFVGYGTSLALDSAGKPHISYHDFSLNDLKYARLIGTEWVIETVPDPAEDVGSWNSLALDSSDNPHISYRDFTNYDLKYARWTGTSWITYTIDWEGNVGEFTSLALDSLDNLHISYYDLDNSNLKYATNATRPPVADANGPYVGTEGVPVTFDGSGSYDPDGTIVSYEWAFGDGEVEFGVSPTHTYTQEGIYTVILMVTDDDGEIDSDFTSADISDTDPDADFSGTPRSGNPPLTVSFTDLSTSYDGIVSWLWSFGDGETSTLQNPTHTYSDLRNYDVSLTVEEADADSDIHTRADYITVHNFTFEIVDSGGDVGMYSSIAVDSNDYPHISYYNSTDGDLKYARWTGSAWVNETVDSSGDVGQFCSLALDIKNNPHICYYDKTNDRLKYAWWAGSEWRFVRLGSGGMYCSLALDSGSFAHISYLGSGLKYAKRTSSGWSFETVDSATGVGAYSSIALDSSDYPHISYFDKGNAGLKYASWNGSAWNFELVDSDGVGTYTSIALDSMDRPHISYYDFANDKLKYAREILPFTWKFQTVDSEGNVGMYSSIALDSSDKPHICYYDVTNADLKYARWDWSILRIDSEGSVGMYCSLALDSYNMPHISYYANGDLKYAHLARLLGDADCDWDVDYDDLMILASAYGSSSGQPAYDERADFDDDGDVDYDDFIDLAGNYMKAYP